MMDYPEKRRRRQMDHAEIQKNIDALVPLMLAKGLRKPEVDVAIRSQSQPRFWLMHLQQNAIHDHDKKYETIPGDSLEAKFEAAREWIDALPSIEERKLTEFMAAVGAAVDMGRELGIDADFVNPLTVLMKTLSENAIAHQAA